MVNGYAKIPMDSNKRHLVIGDIHGKYDLLMELLALANYEPTTDMVYSVGDMIDRGDNSVEVIKFFTESNNTHAIMGNHEYMMLDHEWFAIWVANGGINTDDSLRAHGLDRQWLTDRIRRLPIVMDVGENDSDVSFRLVHADVPKHWSSDDLILNCKNMDISYLSNQLQWSRQMLTRYQTAGMIELHAMQQEIRNRNDRNVFCGHTWVDDVFTIGNQTFLDTGPNRLSMIDASTKEIFRVYL